MGFVTGLAMSVAIAAAAEADAASAECPAVADYATWREAPDQVWDYRTPKIVLLGAVHSRDPKHEQFRRIASAFREGKPSIAFFEGPDRGTRATAAETIAEAGESGYVRFLAAEAGISAVSLELAPGEQMKALLAEFPADQVLLFFVLREAARLRDRENLSGDALEKAVATLLQRVGTAAGASGISLPFSDVKGLDEASRRYWPGRGWQGADSAWFSPTADDRATGGLFAAAINRADSTNRNRHMAALLAEAVTRGERPFVAVGRNHVPMIAPRLACLIEER